MSEEVFNRIACLSASEGPRCFLTASRNLLGTMDAYVGFTGLDKATRDKVSAAMVENHIGTKERMDEYTGPNGKHYGVQVRLENQVQVMNVIKSLAKIAPLASIPQDDAQGVANSGRNMVRHFPALTMPEQYGAPPTLGLT